MFLRHFALKGLLDILPKLSLSTLLQAMLCCCLSYQWDTKNAPTLNGGGRGEVQSLCLRTLPQTWGGGVLPYISHRGMCRPKGYGLWAFLV